MKSRLPPGLADKNGSTNIPPLAQIADPVLHQQASAVYMVAFRSIFFIVFPVGIVAGTCFAFVRVEVGAKELRRRSQEIKEKIIIE